MEEGVVFVVAIDSKIDILGFLKRYALANSDEGGYGLH